MYHLTSREAGRCSGAAVAIEGGRMAERRRRQCRFTPTLAHIGRAETSQRGCSRNCCGQQRG